MNDDVFFATLRKTLFPGGYTQEQVNGLNALLSGWRLHFLSTTSVTQFAYCLATTYHETGAKMAPVVENLNYTTAAQIRKTWPSRFPSDAAAVPYVRNPRLLANKVYNGRMGNRVGTDDGWNYRGRSLVQLTGRDNYEKATQKLRALGLLQPHESLVENPDLALRADIAVELTILGMEEGWFTGVTLDKTIDDKIDGDELRDFTDGRRIINGTDKAAKIAAEGVHFLNALVAAGATLLKAPVSGGNAPAAVSVPAFASTPSLSLPGHASGIPTLDAAPAAHLPPSGWLWLDRLRAAFPVQE